MAREEDGFGDTEMLDVHPLDHRGNSFTFNSLLTL